MKPNFALNLTDTSIALLHRTAKGWLKIGETPFDAPDLPEALDYLRKTALGLEPQGFATKLVIPNSQILYVEVEAPGPDAESRLEQIAAALETRTPLTREEMIFDWTGEGSLLQVAAVARETLAEAEDFATTHRFNPVSFVAIPENDVYPGEPWFGPTAAAPGLIDAGETVERDAEAIAPLAEGGRRAKAAVPPAPEPDIAPTPDPMPAPEPAPVPAPEPEAEPEPDLPPEMPEPADPVPEPEIVPEIVPDIPPQPAPQPTPEPEPIPAPDPEIPDGPGPEITPGPDLPGGPADEPWMGAPPALQAAPAPQPPPRAAAPAPQPTARPAPPPAPAGPGLTVAGLRPLATPPAAVASAAAATNSPAPAAAEAEEAPFTHVADPEPVVEPLPDEELAISPAAQIAAAAAAAPARGPVPARTAIPLPADPDDDLPPAPPPAVTAAFASRRQMSEAAGTGAPTLPAASRPDAAALARAARGKPIEELPPLPRAPQPAARPAAPGARGMMKSLGATPGANRKVKGKPAAAGPGPAAAAGRPAATPAAAAGTANPAAASRSLGNTPFALRQPPRGKPRFLGLILTAILLVCLALVAAWSSFYLARTDTADGAAIAAADPTTTGPAIEDEMAADGIDEADLAAEAGTTAAEEETAAAEAPAAPEAVAETAAEPAPATAVPADSPAAVALVDPQDEIFLSAADAPPPAFDPLSLPEPVSGAEAAPAAPMPPPAFGTVFQFDDNGQIVPQAGGITAPGGYTLYAGKPDKIPPPRSAAAEKAATDARLAAAAVEAAPVVSEPAATAGNDTVPAVPVGGEATAEVTAVQNPNPDLADRRPRLRPEGAAPAEEDGARIALPDDAQKASLRPRARPATILAAGEKARAETAAASLAAGTPAPEAEVELASAAVNPSVLTISRRPAPRPEDFSRAVEAAVAAAARMPDPEPEPAPTAKKKSKTAAAAPEVKPEEQSEIDEPEVASVAPKIPTKASVAKQATFKNAINLSKVNLIGVYGTPSKRYALVRLANGKYKKVRIGDRIDGGTVQAITQTEVRYQKGGRLVALAMPRG